MNRFAKLSLFSQGVMIGIGLGLLIYWFVGKMIKPQDTKRSVLALRSQIAKGESIQEKHLKLTQVPAAYIPTGAISPEDRQLILNKFVRSDLEGGAILRWQDLQGATVNANLLSESIPMGYRALAISLGGDRLEKSLRPGDRIDLLGTFRSKSVGKEFTKTLLQGVLVLQTDPTTLLLTPKDAELLLFAKGRGSLFASLRNPDDQQIAAQIPERDFSQIVAPPLSRHPRLTDKRKKPRNNS